MVNRQAETLVEETRWRLMEAKMVSLSQTERLVIQSFFYDGMEMREIAEGLGISLRGAYAIKQRALRKLKNALVEEE